MASLIPGYSYDIFISYRQKDNKYDDWVTEFVDHLKRELEATFKEEISVYFDINPSDYLLESYDVDASLKDKLKCLIFIPIISRTYCDPKSFAWEHEFKAFVEQASQDQFGLKVKLSSGNVASRVLPIRIYDLDTSDIKLCESVLGGMLRSVDLIYKSTGVNRPLRANEDHPQDNLNRTYYRDQINKVANSIKEIINAIGQHEQKPELVQKEMPESITITRKSDKTRIIAGALILLALIVLGILVVPKLFKPSKELEKSIAVLPFKLLSDEPDKQYLADGMMDAITLHLSKIKDLRVLSRTSTEQYKESGKTMVEIGRELGVTYLLEGSFQKYGNDVRLIVQLIQAGKEGHVWANQYDRKWNDILSIQSEVAQAIAGELDVVITPKEKQLIEKTPTYNLSAYDAYLQGEFYFKKFTQDDLMTAMKYFELAKERDSLYALAYAGIFKVWGGLQQMGYVAPAEAGPKAIKAALKSLLLDSTLAEVHYTLGIMETYVEWNWIAAEASFKKGIELNPNYAEARAYYSHLLNILGRSEEAMKQIEIALSLDPLNPFIKVFYGIDLIFVHKYEEAIAVFQNALKIQPNYLLAIQNMAIALHLAGKYKESFEQFKLSYNSYPDVVIALDQGNAQGGYQQGFISANRVLEERFNSGYWNPTDIAGNYALAGDNDKAIEWLETAYTIHDPNLIYLLMPHYDNLRNYPRFQALCLKMNLPIK